MNKKKVNNKYYIQTELIAYIGDLQSFQNEVNEFAKTHTVIGIKYQSFLVDTLYGSRAMDRALIMYKVRVNGEEVDENNKDRYIAYLQRKLNQHNITYRADLDEEVEE